MLLAPRPPLDSNRPRLPDSISGIGPRIWLENTGPWKTHTGPGTGGTVLAATGDGLDGDQMARILASCELTDSEMDAGFEALDDPFGLQPN
jgi:hypothetical protein